MRPKDISQLHSMVGAEKLRETIEKHIVPVRPETELQSNANRPADIISQLRSELNGLLQGIAEFLRKYIKFANEHQPIVIALWIAHTYVHQAFDYTPYLHIYSPEKRSGKTRLLDCLALVTMKPWRVVSVSEAVLFRKIDIDHPTLLLDEVDTVFGRQNDNRQEPLRALLNAGFESKTKIPRCVPQGHGFTLKEFDVFCPKALAGIGKLPDTISDRCIPIRLLRRTPSERVAMFRKRDVQPDIVDLRRGLERWAADPNTIKQLGPPVGSFPPQLTDRQVDICEPLLVIADLAGSDWPVSSRNAVVALYDSTTDKEDTLGIKLLTAIRDIFDAHGQDRISTQRLLEALVDFGDGGPWPEWWERDLKLGNTRGPAAKLSYLLKPYGIQPQMIRDGDETIRGYYRHHFEEAWLRYLSPLKDATT